ncbi:hypothetical protein ACOMHN_033608 [Nucella lapillus]
MERTKYVSLGYRFEIDFFQDGSDDNVEDGYGFEDGMGDSDETLTPLQRLEKYLQSENIFNRQMVARNMLDTLRASWEEQETCRAVLDCMARLSHDAEPSVRSELMEQVPHIAVYCQENKILFNDAMPTYILPMVVRYMNDANNQVRKTSQAALLVLLEQGLVEKEDIEDQVVSVILDLASPSSHDDYRTEAVALMSKMAPLLGRDITERLFLPRFCEMLTDPLFHVRKVCASNFGEVCSVVGVQSSEEVLLPKFYTLCGDGVWGVRKACAECFMTISCACSLDTRRQFLAGLFVDLLSDQSRWVRMSAYQNLGPFISTFADPRLTGLYVAEDGSIVLQGAGEHPALLQAIEGGEDISVDRVFDEESLVVESRLSEEMDVVLSDEEAAGEGLNEGKLVMAVGDSDLSVEERRAEHIHQQCAGDEVLSQQSHKLSSPSEEESSLEKQMTSLSIDDSKPKCDSSRTEENVVDTESKLQVAASDDDDDDEKCDKCTENDQPKPMLSDFDNASVASLVSSQTQISVPSQIGDHDASSVSTTASGSQSDRVHVHLDNSNFNTFQFWRPPLPEVDIDFDVINGAPANIHIVAKVKDEEKHKVYSTHVDVMMSSDGDEASGSSFSLISDGAMRREVDLHGVRIHTASVSTVSDADETVRNIGSTNILGDSLGECTLAVVDGVVKDLSGNSIGYMDAQHHHVDDSVLAQQQDIIPQSLLENYLGMVEPSRAQTVDTEITRHCAYNLPAVAYTLGRQNWHCIKQLYETLAQAMQASETWKVRRTLAFSIHEMALIEGDEITHRDLLPVFDGFVKDLDEVRIGVLKHLADFLRLLRPEVRQQYLTKLSDFMKTDNHRNWRFRQELAE